MTAPLPETTRVKGGGSARIGAVVLAVALVGVVWIGISGRPSPGPVAVVSPDASSSPGATLAVQTPTPTSEQTPAPTPEPADTYGATLAMGNVRYVTTLSELEPGHLTGELHFPSPPLRPTGTFSFSELWHDGVVEGAEAIGEWAVDLAALALATREAIDVVQEVVPANVSMFDVPPPVTRGYDIAVSGSNDLLFSQLSIDVRLGDGRPDDDGRGTATVRFGVGAEVGRTHRNLILEPGENGSFKGTFTLPRPRRAITGNLILYDVQVTTSHDVWAEVAEFPIDLAPDMASVGVSRLILEQTDVTYRIVARTNGNVRGQSINVTVIARRITPSE